MRHLEIIESAICRGHITPSSWNPLTEPRNMYSDGLFDGIWLIHRDTFTSLKSSGVHILPWLQIQKKLLIREAQTQLNSAYYINKHISLYI